MQRHRKDRPASASPADAPPTSGRAEAKTPTSTDSVAQRAAFLGAGRARRAAIVALRRQALGCTTLDAAFDTALDTARSMLPFDYAKICEYEARSDALTVRAVSGFDKALIGHRIENASTTSQSGYALRRRRPIVVEDLQSVPELALIRHLCAVPPAGAATVLIHAQLGDYGALTLQAARRRLLEPDELKFLQAIADVIAAAVYRFGMRGPSPRRPQRGGRSDL